MDEGIKNGKLRLMTIVGTRPEIIRLSAVIKCADKYFDHVLVHTGQNYDYTLNQIFFEQLKLREPDYYLDAAGSNLGETMGNIIARSYNLMTEVKPEALLILGDTNSALSAISAKRAWHSRILKSIPKPDNFLKQPVVYLGRGQHFLRRILLIEERSNCREIH